MLNINFVNLNYLLHHIFNDNKINKMFYKSLRCAVTFCFLFYFYFIIIIINMSAETHLNIRKEICI